MPEGADAAMAAIRYIPRPAQHANQPQDRQPPDLHLTVFQHPGPRLPMYMRGCELEAV